MVFYFGHFAVIKMVDGLKKGLFLFLVSTVGPDWTSVAQT